MARGIIVLDHPTTVEIKLGPFASMPETFPPGEVVAPCLQILIDGTSKHESSWQRQTSGLAGHARYVHPGETGGPALDLPAGTIEFRIQARGQAVLSVQVQDGQSAPGWRFEWSKDKGENWLKINGLLPITLHKR